MPEQFKAALRWRIRPFDELPIIRSRESGNHVGHLKGCHTPHGAITLCGLFYLNVELERKTSSTYAEADYGPGSIRVQIGNTMQMMSIRNAMNCPRCIDVYNISHTHLSKDADPLHPEWLDNAVAQAMGSLRYHINERAQIAKWRVESNVKASVNYLQIREDEVLAGWWESYRNFLRMYDTRDPWCLVRLYDLKLNGRAPF